MVIFEGDFWAEMFQLLSMDFEDNLKREMLEVSRAGGFEKSTLSANCRRIELSIKIRALYSLVKKFNHYHNTLCSKFSSFSNDECLEVESQDKYLGSFYFRSIERRRDIAKKFILDLMEAELLELGVKFPFRCSLKIESDTYLCIKGKKKLKKMF